MVNSILIGKVLYQKLKENKNLTKLVGEKIFPLIAEQTTTYPFCIYYRTNITSIISNKDGLNEDSVSFTLVAGSTSYSQSLEIANELRRSLESKRIISEDMIITDSHITGIDESYEDNAYVQRLNFECTVNNL